MVLPLILSLMGSGAASAGALGTGILANPLVAGAIGSGLGTAVETGDLGEGLKAGLMSFAGGKLFDVGGKALGIGGAGDPTKMLPGQTTVGGNMTTGTPLYSQPGMTGQALLPPPSATNPTGIMGMFNSGKDFMTTPEGIGMMAGPAIGSMIPGMFGSGGGKKKKSLTAGKEMKPIPVVPNVPGADYRPGYEAEFDYGLGTPRSAREILNYRDRGYAGGGRISVPHAYMQGGEVHVNFPGMGVARFAKGGIASMVPMAEEAETVEDPLVSEAIKAIRGESDKPEIALAMFVQRYGEDALVDLADQVEEGRMISGPGDGMDDQVPATIEGQKPALLSNNEYVIPADVVSGLGNGSSDAGAKKLDDMLDRVRMARTGKKEQPPRVPDEQMMVA